MKKRAEKELKISSGKLRIKIDLDGEISELCFNPQDVGFAQGVYELAEEFSKRESAAREKYEALP
ncbi:MAG: hypothetical protein IJC39_05680, partial [Firmicutes bacterium]|nr:hypothetical protein [Bacillota bacterium]